MARFFTVGLAAVAATALFAACVNLTQPPWGQANDAGDTGGSGAAARAGSGGAVVVGPDAAGGASGGGVATGGTPTGGVGGLPVAGGTTAAAPGGTSGTPTGGAGGNVAQDAGPVAGAPRDGGVDVPVPTDTNRPVDLPTGGTATGGTSAGGTSGTAAGGAGGTIAADAGPVAGTTSPRDVGVDVAPDATGGSGGAGAGGTGGAGTGGAVADAAIVPMIISIDFVGGGVAVDSGATGTVVMGATESAGVKPATHWNSAASNTGTMASLKLADGTTTSASATWTTPVASGETSATWSLDWPDSPGDVRMMNGYLDPRATASPATINVTGLASPMSSGYDVYVYCFEDMTWADTRTSKYTIGSTTHTVKQTEPPQVTSFPGYTLAPEGGAGNYVMFKNVTGSSFTLTAMPGTSLHSTVRAPVNGIQIVYPSGS